MMTSSFAGRTRVRSVRPPSVRFLPVLSFLLASLASESATAAPVSSGKIHLIPDGITGSGNGTLDLRMMTFSGSEIGNDAGGFDGDNANADLPQGGGRDTNSFAESYVTSAADMQAYYTLNFGVTTPGAVEIVLFLDLNETGATAQQLNWMSKLDIILNPDTINGNLDPALDIFSAEQEAIDQIYSGGTLEAYLSPGGPVNLPVLAQGGGWADYAFFTGIDPFALAASDVLLFNISMDTLNNGSEEIFLSGTYSSADVSAALVNPEPSSAVLLGVGLIGLTIRARRAARDRRDRRGIEGSSPSTRS